VQVNAGSKTRHFEYEGAEGSPESLGERLMNDEGSARWLANSWQRLDLVGNFADELQLPFARQRDTRYLQWPPPSENASA
jgi:hypothetical protein